MCGVGVVHNNSNPNSLKSDQFLFQSVQQILTFPLLENSPSLSGKPVCKITYIQECIPVGCVPPAAVAVGVLGGGVCLPQCMLRDPPKDVGLETSLGVGGPGDPPKARPLNFPPGCGPGDLLQDILGYHLQCMLGYHPPVNSITDTCKNITLPQLRCGGKN